MSSILASMKVLFGVLSTGGISSLLILKAQFNNIAFIFLCCVL